MSQFLGSSVKGLNHLTLLKLQVKLKPLQQRESRYREPYQILLSQPEQLTKTLCQHKKEEGCLGSCSVSKLLAAQA